jgi:hypothetical protein
VQGRGRLTSRNRDSGTIVGATVTDISFVALHLVNYTISKSLRRTLGIGYNDETVFGDILSKEGTVARRRRFSFLYGHFISITVDIEGKGRDIYKCRILAVFETNLRSFGTKDIEEGHRITD